MLLTAFLNRFLAESHCRARDKLRAASAIAARRAGEPQDSEPAE
jgi:hypothetical protein